TSAFLNFVGMRNVDVSGEGTIDGSGDAWAGFGQGRGGAPRGPAPAGQPAATAANTATPAGRAATAPAPAPALPTALPRPQDVYPSPLPTTAAIHFAPDRTRTPIVNAAGVRLGNGASISLNTPPRALVFQDCTDVRVAGLTLKNQARWGYVFIYC